MRTKKVCGALAVVASLISMSSPAWANMTSANVSYGATSTTAYGTTWTGTGSVYAYQNCQTSNGQTNWTIYGSTRYTLYVNSTAGNCTYIIGRGRVLG
jgi:hypothetical protein